MSNTQEVTNLVTRLRELDELIVRLKRGFGIQREDKQPEMDAIIVGLQELVAALTPAVVPSVDEILRNMISGEESCARPRPAYLRALRDVRKVFAAAPPVVAPVAPLDEHPDNTLKIACAELAGYYDGFEGLPVNATYSTSDENLAYQLWFGKARKVRSDLVDQIDTLAKLLTDARAQLAPPVAPVVAPVRCDCDGPSKCAEHDAVKQLSASLPLTQPVAAPVQEQADDLCGRCGYQRFRHTAYYQRQHGQTMPAAPQICNAFTSPSLPLTQPVAAPMQARAVCTCRHDSGMSTACSVHYPVFDRPAASIERVRATFEAFTIAEVKRFNGIPPLTPEAIAFREAVAKLLEE